MEFCFGLYRGCYEMNRKDLVDMGFEDIVLFENPGYDDCIIGVSIDNRAIYSYSQMIGWFANKNNCSFAEAMEFIDYNTVRSLPYIENSPIIVNDLIEF